MKKIISTLYEYVNESIENDINYNKEAKRIYNKIKRNVEKIILIPTDKNDVVKDSRGIYHTLKGVKFNLKDIKEKYDVNILFVNKLGKNSNHHFNKTTNSLTFFILSQNQDELDFVNNSYQARLRFESWIPEHIFIHEFIHYLDSNKYTNTYNFTNPKTEIDYYNSAEEYNAYTHEIISNILQNKKKLIGLSFNRFLKTSLKFGNENFINNLNDTFLRKLKNRLYQIYIEINK